MATDYYIELTGEDIDGDGDNDPIEYHFDLVQNLSERGDIPFTEIEVAGNELINQQISFSGKSVRIPIEWILYDNGNDKASGTWGNQLGSSFDSNLGSDIKTVQDQIYYLRRYIHISNIGASWTLWGGRFTDPDGDGTDEGTDVTIENLNLQEAAGRPISARGSMMLRVGQRV